VLPRRRRRACLALAVAGGLLATAPSALADSGPTDPRTRQQQVQQQLTQAGQAVDDDNAQVAADQAVLAAIQTKLPAAQARLGVAQVASAAAADADARAAADLAAAQQAERDSQAQVDAAQAQVDLRANAMQAVSRSLYMVGPYADLAAVFQADGPEQLVERTGTLQASSHNTADLLGQMRAAKAALDARTAELAQQRQATQTSRDAAAAALATQQSSLAEAQAAKAEVDGLVAQQQQTLAASQEHLAQAQAQYASLQAESGKIQAQLAALAAAAAAASPGPSAPAPAPSKAGLIRPAQGPLTSPFGMRYDPVMKTTQLHAGQDIGASMGSPIWAAKAGTVVLVESEASSGGYGNYTCIAHGGGFDTCYAHQSEVRVHVGQEVAQGQVIGLVGSTGFSTGPHLHFEVRINGTPVDPAPYL
jgi:murein DD-endopeptidase MepM/ murein hydrolase activator NlpD